MNHASIEGMLVFLARSTSDVGQSGALSKSSISEQPGGPVGLCNIVCTRYRYCLRITTDSFEQHLLVVLPGRDELWPWSSVFAQSQLQSRSTHLFLP